MAALKADGFLPVFWSAGLPATPSDVLEQFRSVGRQS